MITGIAGIASAVLLAALAQQGRDQAAAAVHELWRANQSQRSTPAQHGGRSRCRSSRRRTRPRDHCLGTTCRGRHRLCRGITRSGNSPRNSLSAPGLGRRSGPESTIRQQREPSQGRRSHHRGTQDDRRPPPRHHSRTRRPHRPHRQPHHRTKHTLPSRPNHLGDTAAIHQTIPGRAERHHCHYPTWPTTSDNQSLPRRCKNSQRIPRNPTRCSRVPRPTAPCPPQETPTREPRPTTPADAKTRSDRGTKNGTGNSNGTTSNSPHKLPQRQAASPGHRPQSLRGRGLSASGRRSPSRVLVGVQAAATIPGPPAKFPPLVPRPGSW